MNLVKLGLAIVFLSFAATIVFLDTSQTFTAKWPPPSTTASATDVLIDIDSPTGDRAMFTSAGTFICPMSGIKGIFTNDRGGVFYQTGDGKDYACTFVSPSLKGYQP